MPFNIDITKISGYKRGMLDVAKALIYLGKNTFSEIAEVTGLSLEELVEIEQELKTEKEKKQKKVKKEKELITNPEMIKFVETVEALSQLRGLENKVQEISQKISYSAAKEKAAATLISLNMNSLEEIVEFTGLSLQEVQKISKKIEKEKKKRKKSV